MPSVKCSQCEQVYDAGEGRAPPRCLRCGVNVAIAANPSAKTSGAIQNDDLLLREMTNLAPLPEQYRDWDELRQLSPTRQRVLTALVIAPRPDLTGLGDRLPPIEMFPNADPELGVFLGSLGPHGKAWSYVSRIAAFFMWSLMVGVGYLLTVWLFDDVLVVTAVAKTFYCACVMFLAFLAGLQCFKQAGTPPVTIWLFENGLLAQFDSSTWGDIADLHIENTDNGRVAEMRLLDGIEVIIAAADGPERGAVIEFIEMKVCAAQFLAKLHRLTAGNRLRFGDVQLDREGVQTPEWFASWSEIRRVSANKDQLIIESSKREGLLMIAVARVAFVPLVLAIIEVMMDEHHRLPPLRGLACSK